LDVVIFGGGVAGLWLLDGLHRAGHGVILLEAAALGRGQTIASQGIIHGGLKYTLDGLLGKSADAISRMPQVWRECLRGDGAADLTRTRVRAESCSLWRTDSLRSRAGMIGARAGLRVRPERIESDERPAALVGCPGDVFALNEQVICPRSLLSDLAAQHRARVLKIDMDAGVELSPPAGDSAPALRLADRMGGRELVLEPGRVVFAAGGGNDALRKAVGLDTTVSQRRPLHMVMVRGALPTLNGHCVDGARTRVTITSDVDTAGRTVWQVGGQVAEDGVEMKEADLLGHARRELRSCIPGLDFNGSEWASYRVDRAEGITDSGRRPDTEVVREEGKILTVWPTKLALSPRLAEVVCAQIGRPTIGALEETFDDWARPAVADPPWEEPRRWYADV
jgi:glycerol-3-phosphate dehydrogenase